MCLPSGRIATHVGHEAGDDDLSRAKRLEHGVQRRPVERTWKVLDDDRLVTCRGDLVHRLDGRRSGCEHVRSRALVVLDVDDAGANPSGLSEQPDQPLEHSRAVRNPERAAAVEVLPLDVDHEQGRFLHGPGRYHAQIL